MIQDVDGAHVDTTFDYDILDNLTSISTDQDADTIATTIMEYDPNDNLSSIILPE
ncbi:MAG: hypothetical protein H6766_04195 [Candidatus Peribacteria bacterium]|nr:MAG: hypothetical protein H6766_04195 [Candidatus Peribacteria bacterium]